MALFPLFIDLNGKKCIFVGGGNVAARKIEALLPFNPEIVVISPETDSRIKEFANEGKLTIISRTYYRGDLAGAFMAVAAASDRRINDEAYNEAVKEGIYINVADSPEKCTFTFPAVVKRDEIVIGISTSGSYPALSKRIRQMVEGVLPEDLGRVAAVLQKFRRKALEEIGDWENRRKFINRALEEALGIEISSTEDDLSGKIQKIFEVYSDEKSNQGGNKGKQTGSGTDQPCD